MPDILLRPDPPTSPGEYLLEFDSLGQTTRVLAQVARDGAGLRIWVNGVRWDTVADFLAQRQGPVLWSEAVKVRKEGA